MPNLRRLGNEAEDAAAEYLINKGYTIVTRRKKMKQGELDLVAMDGETLVFVEVKLRDAPGYLPEESIGNAKARALQLSAEQYVFDTGEHERPTRFDLIAIDRDGIRHLVGIFD